MFLYPTYLSHFGFLDPIEFYIIGLWAYLIKIIPQIVYVVRTKFDIYVLIF
jgi:hypothetical protein